MVHRAQQPFEAVFQEVLETVEVHGVLHTVLQTIDVFAQLGMQVVGGRASFGMPLTGGLKVVLKRLKTPVELFEIRLELMLTTISNRQHQDRKIVEDRQ